MPRPFFFWPRRVYVSDMADPKIHRCDVAIAGGGPVGLTLALALARRGYETVVADAGSPPGKGGSRDTRAYFIAYGVWRIFKALGLEEALLAGAEPVMQVEAEGRIGGINFIAEDCAEPVLGYMVEARQLASVLHAAVEREQTITLLSGAAIEAVTFDDPCAVLKLAGDEVNAPLVVGCDGARSIVRRAAGLRFEGHDYDATAISTTVKLSQPHNGAARQVFLPNGPMAVLPLRDDHANLIWTEKAAVAKALLALDERGFELELAKKAGDFVPGARLAGARHSFPIGLYVAERFDAKRMALAGDSAHVIHPLGGQGLNLGLKDVAALVDVIAGAGKAGLDIGAASALEPYTRWRRTDVAATAAAMEGFARVFSAPLPVRLAAGLAMSVAGSVRETRKVFAKEAGGDMGELPTLMAR